MKIYAMEDGFYTHTVTIPQIKCYRCIKTIERILLAVPGIYQVKANIFLKKVKIWHTNHVSYTNIVNTLSKHNFKCTNENNSYSFKLIILLILLFIMKLINLFTDIFNTSIFNLIILNLIFFNILLKNNKFIKEKNIFFVFKGSIFSFLLGIFYFVQGNFLVGNCYFELSIYIIIFVYFSKWLESFIYVRNTKKYFEMQSNYLNKNEFNYKIIFEGDPSSNNAINSTINEILIGDILFIYKDSYIPTDGYIYKDSGIIDESNLTGEFKLQKKIINQSVYAGTKAMTNLYVKVTKIPQDTLLGRIINTIEQSNYNYQYTNILFSSFINILDKISVLIFVYYILLGLFNHLFTINYLLFILENTLSAMIIFCPCTFTLAIPITFFIFNFKFLENNILIKNCNLLFNEIDYFLFDKTGTLTQGRFSVVRSEYYKDINFINSIIKSIEVNEDHPIGKCLFKYTESNSTIRVISKEYLSGKGIKCILEYKEKIFEVRIGHLSFVIPSKSNISINSSNYTKSNNYDVSNNVESNAGSNDVQVFVAVENSLAAIFYLNDSIKPEALDLINYLKSKSITTCLVTGDTLQSALQINSILNLDYIKYNCTAQYKLNLVKQFKLSGKVAYLGDGINDSLAINESDLGITISKLNNSNVTLLTEDLKYVKMLFEIKSLFVRKVRVNVCLSVVYNVVCLVVSLGVVIRPNVACYCMFISFVSVLVHTLN